MTEGVITDPFVLNWLDLLCFLLSGLPADGTIAAEVAFMFNEWYRPESCLEFPRGGSQAMVNALVRWAAVTCKLPWGHPGSQHGVIRIGLFEPLNPLMYASGMIPFAIRMLLISMV